ncbi:phosphatidylinositol transfer protein [Trichinella nativa]|uniref:Phosphatidylinositol transfer protein n=1 Tax=Trichinella nativa TaxID=6335 RepID=A0A1Y3EN79_9BILA|nr:phosphatidylinositol transfer protein [Trichinella nativa]
MLIKEYRIVLPLTVEEYQVAQLWAVAEASKNETGGGEGIEVLRNEPYSNYPLLDGAYDVAKVETIHLPDRGDTPNPHNLPPEILAQREIVYIDIANDPIDPCVTRTGRGPLTGNWQDSCEPVMCCYKLVTVEFRWWGLQSRVEAFIHKSERRLFQVFHRELFCWTDQWYGLTMQDIRKIEDETKIELDVQRSEGSVRGMSAAE